MLHVIKFTSPEDIEKFGDLYLINIQKGDNEVLAYVYSPKYDRYIKCGWSSIRFAYFLDDKGNKYDMFLKRIRERKIKRDKD